MEMYKKTVELLKDRAGFIAGVTTDAQRRHAIIWLFLGALSYFAMYGFIIGCYHSPLQAFSSAIKLPILYILTLVVCFPTLFVFNQIIGSKHGPLQHLLVLMVGLNLTGVILVSFASVTFFFLTTVPDYDFFILLNVTIFSISGYFGVRGLHASVLQSEGDTDTSAEARLDEEVKLQRANRRWLLMAWMLLYGIVGAQLGWTLRPFFGSPDLPFEIIREQSGNFFWAVGRTWFDLFSGQ